MMNYDYWKKFIKSGKIDDYLQYIACTQEEDSLDAQDKFLQGINTSMNNIDITLKNMDSFLSYTNISMTGIDSSK